MTSPKSPAQLASDAAEAVRGLNHATLGIGHLDWEYPSDAYSAIGGLERMTGYLPQAIGQTDSLLANLRRHGHVGSTTGNPEEKVAEARAALEEAITAAAALNSALQRAHSATSPLTYKD